MSATMGIHARLRAIIDQGRYRSTAKPFGAEVYDVCLAPPPYTTAGPQRFRSMHPQSLGPRLELISA
jgi:hypothetical protein